MMSERKRKQKWSLNPRGKNWSDNSNKFGQKLLEKMGWSAGKGLGANEDGMTEHIRVAYKNDTQGMGFKTKDDQWTEHESNFTELLNTLSANNSNEVESESKLSSLEKKSQISKARVHYHKFTRGKDLSRYSEKDLANIFGKKSLKDLSKPQTAKEEKHDEKENTESKSFGVVTLNGGNMLDYFKNKLPNFKSNTNGTLNSTNKDSESDSERTSFGLGFGQNGKLNEEKQEPVNNKPNKNKQHQVDNFNKRCFGLGYDRYNENESKPKGKFTSFVKSTATDMKEPLKFGIKFNKTDDKKTVDNSSDHEIPTVGFGFKTDSNKGKIQSSFMSFVKGSDQSNNLEAGEVIEDNMKMKKKRKKEFDNENIEEQGTKKRKLESGALTVDNGGVNLGLGFLNKKKDTKPTFVSFIKESETVETEGDGVNSPTEKKKNKNNRSKKKENDDEILDNTSTENKEDVTVEVVRKKRKNKKSEETEELDETQDTNNENENIPSKKSKKRKSESENDVAFTPIKKKFKNFEDLHSLQDEEKMVETPIKKSKKNKVPKNNSEGLANPAFDPLHNEVTVQKHHLDAIVEESESLVESPVDIIAQEDLLNEDSSLQCKSEKKKKKKSKNFEGIDNPCVTELSTIDESFQSIDDSVSVPETQKRKKNKKSKKEKDHTIAGIANGAFNENFIVNGHTKESELDDKYEVKEKKKKRQEDSTIEIFSSGNLTNGEEKPKKKKNKMNEIAPEMEQRQSELEVDTPKNKKKKKRELLSVENPCFNSNDSLVSLEATPNKYEVKRNKKNKNLGIVNPGLDLTSPPPSNGVENETVPEELPVVGDGSLMLNVVCTPIMKKDKDNKLQRRKSVRFSDVNQSIFINNMDSPADLRKNGGQDNAGYDQFGNRIEESLDTLNKQLDDFQAEVENDLNEAKVQVMVGEVGDPNGENEILDTGEVKLKFKYANFGKMPSWMRKDNRMSPKSSYRHLIKGDIILGFKNTNMHDIKGYNEHLKATASP